MQVDRCRYDSPTPVRGRRRSMTPTNSSCATVLFGCEAPHTTPVRSTGRRRSASNASAGAGRPGAAAEAVTPRAGGLGGLHHSGRRRHAAMAEASTPGALWFGHTSESLQCGTQQRSSSPGVGVAGMPVRKVAKQRLEQAQHHHEAMWFGGVDGGTTPRVLREKPNAQDKAVCGSRKRSGSAGHTHQQAMIQQTHDLQCADRSAAARMHKKRFPDHPSMGPTCLAPHAAEPQVARHFPPLAAPYGTSPCNTYHSIATHQTPQSLRSAQGAGVQPQGHPRGMPAPDRARQMQKLGAALSSYRRMQR